MAIVDLGDAAFVCKCPLDGFYECFPVLVQEDALDPLVT